MNPQNNITAMKFEENLINDFRNGLFIESEIIEKYVSGWDGTISYKHSNFPEFTLEVNFSVDTHIEKEEPSINAFHYIDGDGFAGSETVYVDSVSITKAVIMNDGSVIGGVTNIELLDLIKNDIGTEDPETIANFK